ncbi:MAG: aspartate aminotransferase family protein [Burkholderiales bacterium]|jgi:alanine-glyoxylate transaminase/(R)-3-amino-2-methylpropionate-pyruvate transaminase
MSALPKSETDVVDRDDLIARRGRFLSPSLRTFPLFPDDPLVLVRGEGAHVFDETGRRYLDGTAQNVCISLGFAHPLTMRMASEAMHRMQHCTSLFFHDEPARYAEELVARMPADGDWVVHLVNSGAEAIDLAYAMARAHTGHFEMVSLRNAYHGLHFGASGSAAFAPCRLPTAAMQGFVHAMHPDQYKGAFGPDAGIEPYLAELERTIFSSTSGRIGGMIVEPIQGFGGVVPMPPGYIRRAFEIVRSAGGLCISDEVQTGFGRMGSHFWGFEAHDATPDIVVVGKGMGNGFPIAGVIARREIAESFTQVRFFNTFGGNPVAVAAARSVLRAIDDEGLQANAAARGAQLVAGLRTLQDRHPLIGDVRGSGLILGIEVVTDRRTRAPAVEAGDRIQKRMRAAGFINVKGSATRNCFRINPPMCVTEGDCDAWLDAFDRALAAEG